MNRISVRMQMAVSVLASVEKTITADIISQDANHVERIVVAAQAVLDAIGLEARAQAQCDLAAALRGAGCALDKPAAAVVSCSPLEEVEQR